MITQEPYKTLNEIKRTSEDTENKIRAILNTWEEERKWPNTTAQRLNLNQQARQIWLGNINANMARLTELVAQLPKECQMATFEAVQKNRVAA